MDTHKELTERIQGISNVIEALNKKRYQNYNEWAVRQLNNAEERWEAEKPKFMGTKEFAEKVFRDYIMEINPQYLMPLVSTLYNGIYQKIYTELSNKADMEYRHATYETRELEDF